MTVQAIVFDIGGVLEITQDLGGARRLESRLGMRPGELDEALQEVWQAGGIGAISEAEVHRCVGAILGLDRAQVDAFMSDMWTEYLGTLNAELAGYLRALRPRYRTGIISNSFVGAREREQQSYGLTEMTDLIIYSHEVGVSKPDRRIFQLACDGLGVRLPEIVLLDDTPAIIHAAREYGIQAVLFRDNAQAIADIEARLPAAPARPGRTDLGVCSEIDAGDPRLG